jgi:hypothetical protein
MVGGSDHLALSKAACLTRAGRLQMNSGSLPRYEAILGSFRPIPFRLSPLAYRHVSSAPNDPTNHVLANLTHRLGGSRG